MNQLRQAKNVALLALVCMVLQNCTNLRTVKIHKYKFITDGKKSYQYIFKTKNKYYWYSSINEVLDFDTIEWVISDIDPLIGMNKYNIVEEDDEDVNEGDLSTSTETSVDADNGDSGASDGDDD